MTNMDELDVEIRNRLEAYLAGELTIEEFEDWFVPASWDHRTQLVIDVDHLLAERDVYAEGVFREMMRQVVSTIVVLRRVGAFSASSTTSVVTGHLSLGTGTVRAALDLVGAGS